MTKDKKNNLENVEPENLNEICQEGQTDCTGCSDAENGEAGDIKAQLEEKTKQCEEYFSRMQRLAAEFDNFKKRTAKEKEVLYHDAVSDCVAVFLPVIDSLTRAIQAAGKEEEGNALKEGIELVYRQMQESLKRLGVEEIKSVGEKFDPQLHNAVMHIEDDSYESSVVTEEFQKGYVIKEKVIRYSMVKVAN